MLWSCNARLKEQLNIFYTNWHQVLRNLVIINNILSYLSQCMFKTCTMKLTSRSWSWFPSSFTKHKTLGLKPKDSNMALNYFVNPFLVVSLASKRPIITWWHFQFWVKKLMTRSKYLVAFILIHKSNVTIVFGVASN